MSYLTLPDPFSGRCKNHRQAQGGYGIETVRCLDYEGHDSACRFPAPLPRADASSASLYYHQTTPKPWVRPDA